MKFHHYHDSGAVSVIFKDGLELVAIPGSSEPNPLMSLLTATLNSAVRHGSSTTEDSWRLVADTMLAAKHRRDDLPRITIDRHGMGQLTLRLPKLEGETPAEAMVRAATLLGAEAAPSLAGTAPLSLLIDDTGEGMPV